MHHHGYSFDRFLYVGPFSPTLPRQQEIGTFKCLLIHHGKDVVCKACNLPGHKIGSDSCIAKPKDVILAFKGYHHPLSNHFLCELEIYDKIFKSAEHAYFYHMACEMGRMELAEEIQEAEHAGKVKHLSKRIADDTERWQWERENTDVMREILQVKADQCEQCRQCLLENCDTVLAEATPSKIWSSDLSPWATEHTDPSYWPGKNMLGAMLMEISAKLVSEHSGEPMQTGAISEEDSSNQQEDSDSETETAADFF